MKTTLLPLFLTTIPLLSAHPTQAPLRQPDALCTTRCSTINTTFALIQTHIASETYIPHNLLSDLYTQQAGILGAGCDYNTCLISPIHPRVEDGFRPNDHTEEASQMSCQELRGRVLKAFSGGFGASVRERRYVCTQELVDVMVWQEQMGTAGVRGRGAECGGLVGGGSGPGDWFA